MKRFSCTAFLSAGVLFAGLASAQTFGGRSSFHDPQRVDPIYPNAGVDNVNGYNDDDYNRPRDRYRNDSYRYGRNSGSLIGQVMSDIDMAASNARLDGHEAKHFNEFSRCTPQDSRSGWFAAPFP
jgi:hypothetical protein